LNHFLLAYAHGAFLGFFVLVPVVNGFLADLWVLKKSKRAKTAMKQVNGLVGKITEA
jgi:hypothetical protein